MNTESNVAKHFKFMVIRLSDNLNYWQNEDNMRKLGFVSVASDCTEQLEKAEKEIETAKALFNAAMESTTIIQVRS